MTKEELKTFEEFLTCQDVFVESGTSLIVMGFRRSGHQLLEEVCRLQAENEQLTQELRDTIEGAAQSMVQGIQPLLMDIEQIRGERDAALAEVHTMREALRQMQAISNMKEHELGRYAEILDECQARVDRLHRLLGAELAKAHFPDGTPR